MSAHPTPEELRGLLEETLDERRCSEVERHIETCERCQAQLEGFEESMGNIGALLGRGQGHPPRSAEFHLLFGLLALQNGLVSRSQLVAAFAKWTSDKSAPLDEMLMADGGLDATARQAVRQMVELHVQRHAGNAAQSLMALSGSDLPAARQELEALDDAELQDSLLKIAQSDPDVTMPPTLGQATGTSGRFRILRRLPGARGGMGEISVAKDEELGRQVALKQILSGKADHTGYRHKFQAEAEITGNLEHPGIVPVYGLGSGVDGRPYYAMRLVHGDNLGAKIKEFHERPVSPGTDEVDYDSVELHGLVDRLVDVAQAIRYAHSRGVLHRDLKPGNILVGEYGETLVIDWGLARLPNTEDDFAVTDATEDGIDSQAPLQIRSGSNVDATMQGQALGTVGYAPPEQLNGRVDLITERSDVYGLGAILYQILVGRPPIAREGQDRKLADLMKDSIAGRITPPRQVRRAIPRTLSAICMRALEREPADRYASVDEFIAELERWKADQPVLAAPDSIGDRVMRLTRRYRAAALAAATALVGIAVVTSGALVVVNRARVNEAAARSEAERLAQRNQTVVDSFVAAFRSADPENEGVSGQMTALEVLQQARTEIENDPALATNQLSKATLLVAIGESLFSLGAYDQAASAHAEALRLQKANLGPAHPDTLTTMNNLAEDFRAAGQFDEALRLYKETFELRKTYLGPSHAHTLLSMNNLASGLRAAGQLEEALPIYEEALRLRKVALGPAHPRTLVSMNDLASAYEAAGRLDESLPLQEETLRLNKAELGSAHPSTLVSMNNLAAGLRASGRVDDAVALDEETLRLRTAKLGPTHPHTLSSMSNLAHGYRMAMRYDEAISLFQETVRLRKSKLGPAHPQTLVTMGWLAAVLMQKHRFGDAEPILRDWQDQLDAQSQAATMARAKACRAFCLLEMGQLGESIEAAKAALAIDKISETQRLNADTVLATAQASQGDPEALDRLIHAYRELRKYLPKMRTHHRWYVSRACQRIIKLFEAAARPDDVREWQIELASVNEEIKHLQ